MKNSELQLALVRVVTEAITKVGFENFKRTSMFLSNERVSEERKAA